MSGDAECKACGLPLLEGRAYELGGHRWHVECFRCSVCEKQLHAHTNMLVLGDGTLVCSNCSYTCSLCNKKITDMAILTNDQAFCADCFVCRNCKRQIDDLQYARTSQGIFCMNCHNALLARKRQRQKQKQQQQQQQQQATGGLANGDGHIESAKSSKSSLDLSSWPSVNRNKDLPGLPDVLTATSALDLSGDADADADARREFKVPRKKLAPSAFAAPADSHEPTTPDDMQPARRSPAKMLEPLGTPPRSNSFSGNLSGNAYAEPPTPEAAASLSHHSASTPPASAPASAPTSATSSSHPTATSNLSVPQRSQLRPASPVRSWRSIKSPGRSSIKDGLQPNGAPGSPASMPTTTISPAKSKTKFWHRRDPSTGSVDAVSLPISAPFTPSMGAQAPLSAPASGSSPGHGRSRSETRVLGSSLVSSSDDLLASVSAERQRADNLEAQLNALYAEIGSLDALQVKREALNVETAEMEAVLARMRDEQRILASKNTQLVEMNQELERRTLEKFGPNSLWGSQNPPPARPTSPNLHGPAPDQPPLVTRLDGNGNGNGASGQPQHPLRSAKHWFMRRPNKGQQNGVIGGVVSGVGAMAGAVGGLANGQPYSGAGLSANAGQAAGSGAGAGALPNGAAGGGAGTGTAGSGSTSAYASDDSAAQPRSLIGDSLALRVEADHAPVPFIVTRCFAEVERRGLDTEGIYRKPGSKSQVDAIMEYFATGCDPELEESMLGGEIQAISSAVKQYLRYLADPVITYDCYDSFIAAGNSRSVQVLRRTVQALPSEHRDTLRAIASHLALVASHEGSNLMNIRNLAMVFAPTIARDETGDREIADMQARNEATQLLITNASSLLDPAADELL